MVGAIIGTNEERMAEHRKKMQLPVLRISRANGDAVEFTLDEPGGVNYALGYLPAIAALFPGLENVPVQHLALVDNDTESDGYATHLGKLSCFAVVPPKIPGDSRDPFESDSPGDYRRTIFPRARTEERAAKEGDEQTGAKLEELGLSPPLPADNRWRFGLVVDLNFAGLQSMQKHSGEFMLVTKTIIIAQTSLPALLLQSDVWSNVERARWVLQEAAVAFEHHQTSRQQTHEKQEAGGLNSAEDDDSADLDHPEEISTEERSLRYELATKRWRVEHLKEVARQGGCYPLQVHGVCFLHHGYHRAAPRLLSPTMTLVEFLLNFGPEPIFEAILQLCSTAARGHDLLQGVTQENATTNFELEDYGRHDVGASSPDYDQQTRRSSTEPDCPFFDLCWIVQGAYLFQFEVPLLCLLAARGWARSLTLLHARLPAYVARHVDRECVAGAVRHRHAKVLHFFADHFPAQFLGAASAYLRDVDIDKVGEHVQTSGDDAVALFFRELLIDTAEEEGALLKTALARVSQKRSRVTLIPSPHAEVGDEDLYPPISPIGGHEAENRDGLLVDHNEHRVDENNIHTADHNSGGFASADVAAAEAAVDLAEDAAKHELSREEVAEASSTTSAARSQDEVTQDSQASTTIEVSGPKPLLSQKPMIGNDSPARCHLPHFARHLAGTCDCAHCHFGLTRAREYCFFLRKQVVAVARVFEESQVVTSLFPDVKEVKIELEDEEAFCKNLFGHELNQVSAPGGGVFAFELPRDVVCVARGSRFRLQLPRGGRGLKISALDPRATGSSSTAAGIQQDLLVMGQDSPEPEEENDDAGYVEQGTREEEDDDTPEDEELDFVEQHDQQQAQGVTPGGRVEYIRASAQRASLISATPRSGLFTPTPRHSTLNASSFAPQKSQFTVPGLGLVLGITPRTEYGDSTQHLYSARRSYDAVATPRSMGEVKTTSAPLLTSRSSAVLSTTPHAVGAAPATRTPRWSTSTTTLVGASALPSARQRYSILSRSATKRPIRVTGAATTPSPVEQVHQLSKTATSAISSQQNALHPASPVYRGILPGRAVNVDPRSHRVTVGPAPRMIFAPVVLPSSTGARSGVGSGYSIGYGSYGAIMKMAHHGVVGLRRFRENVR